MENSLIYSNTNFLANGSEVRHNTAPVVLVKGECWLWKGEVYIRGDEAATGTDPDYREKLQWTACNENIRRYTHNLGQWCPWCIRRRKKCHDIRRWGCTDSRSGNCQVAMES